MRFAEVNADDVEECGHEKDVNKLEEKIMLLEQENYRLRMKLTQSK